MKTMPSQVALIRQLKTCVDELREAGVITREDARLRKGLLVSLKRMFEGYYTVTELERVALCSDGTLVCVGWRCSWSDKKLREGDGGVVMSDCCPDCESVRSRHYDEEMTFTRSEIDRSLMDRPRGSIPMQLARLEHRLRRAEKQINTLVGKHEGVVSIDSRRLRSA